MEKLAYQRPDVGHNQGSLATLPFMPPLETDLSDDEDEEMEYFPFPMPRNRRNAMELDPYIMAQLNQSLENNQTAREMRTSRLNESTTVMIPSVVPNLSRRSTGFRRSRLQR